MKYLLALLLAFAAGPSVALTLESYQAPDGVQQLADPDERLRIRRSDEDRLRDPTFSSGGSGLGLSIFGNSGSRDGPAFLPGFDTPGQYGPRLDPQTGDPYWR